MIAAMIKEKEQLRVALSHGLQHTYRTIVMGLLMILLPDVIRTT
jgi:hypothetical protein